MKTLKFLLYLIILIFAVVGLLFSSVFIAMQFGWLNVRGSIESRNSSILSINTTIGTSIIPTTATDVSRTEGQATCRWDEQLNGR